MATPPPAPSPGDEQRALEISDFYAHIRAYWAELSRSAAGELSGMLNFGYWPPGTPDLFAAQQAFVAAIRERALGSRAMPRSGLEIGCGIGGVSIAMLRTDAGLAMTALDISRPQLALARANAELAGVAPRLNLVQGNAMALPFADAAFDFTLCIESTFHYEDKAAFFAENHRVLKPGAHAVLADITCEDTAQIRYRKGNHFEGRADYLRHAAAAGFQLESELDIGPAVYRPLHDFVAQFNRQHRIASGKYWSVVLANYTQLAAAGRMGYHLFRFRKVA